MKQIFLLFVALVAGSQCRAQWAVIDAANLTQSIVNYAGILQQISNQAQQIQQSQDTLNRLGNMASITSSKILRACPVQ
jgi:P-type conjugative transfer protein TrbJ